MRALPLELTERQAGPKLISLIKEARKQKPSNLKKKITKGHFFFNMFEGNRQVLKYFKEFFSQLQ